MLGRERPGYLWGDGRGKLSKDWKDHTEIELDSNGYVSARNAETELSSKLSWDHYQTTRDYAWHILIKKSFERIFQRNTLCYH
jgi:hypothetical protein